QTFVSGGMHLSAYGAAGQRQHSDASHSGSESSLECSPEEVDGDADLEEEEAAATPSPLCDAESALPIRVLSSNARQLFGQRSEDLLGQPLSALLGVEQAARLLRDLASTPELSELQPWPCVLHVRQDVFHASAAMQDVLRDRANEERRIARL